MAGQALAAGQMVVEIHSVPKFGTAAVAPAELFATVVEIVAVADAAVDARLVDETVGVVAGVGGAAAGAVTGAAVGAMDAMSGEVFDERDSQRGPAPGERSYRLAMLAAGRY